VSLADATRIVVPAGDAGISYLVRRDRAPWPAGRYELQLVAGDRAMALAFCLAASDWTSRPAATLRRRRHERDFASLISSKCRRDRGRTPGFPVGLDRGVRNVRPRAMKSAYVARQSSTRIVIEC
jgi:hypothetical protein